MFWRAFDMEMPGGGMRCRRWRGRAGYVRGSCEPRRRLLGGRVDGRDSCGQLQTQCFSPTSTNIQRSTVLEHHLTWLAVASCSKPASQPTQLSSLIPHSSSAPHTAPSSPPQTSHTQPSPQLHTQRPSSPPRPTLPRPPPAD